MTRDGWRSDGHLGDGLVAAFADGQPDALGDDVVVHLAECSACAERVGEAAELAGMVAEALEVGARARRPLPWVALAAAMLVALVGALPAALSSLAELKELPALALRASLAIVQAGAVVWGQMSTGSSGVVLVWMSALVLLLMGTVVARRGPRGIFVKGEA